MRRFVLAMGCALALASCGMKNTKPTAANEPPKQATPPAASTSQPPPAQPVSQPPKQPPGGQPAPSQPPAAVRAGTPAEIALPSLPGRLEAQNDAEKKLDGSLLQIARAARSGGTRQAEATAKNLSVLGDDQRIKIDAALMDKSKVPAFREAVAKLGGEVIVCLENHVFLFVPPAAIEALSQRADVHSLAVASATVRP